MLVLADATSKAIEEATLVTARATVVLAVVAGITLLANLGLTWVTARAAKAAVRQLETNYPWLGITWSAPASDAKWIEVLVSYETGVTPAVNVEVFARAHGRYYSSVLGTMTPGDPRATQANLLEPDPSWWSTPFRQFRSFGRADEGGLGVSWRCPDGSRRRNGYRTVRGDRVGSPIT